MKFTVIVAIALGSKDQDCFFIPTQVLETFSRDLTGLLFLLMAGSRIEEFNWEWVIDRTPKPKQIPRLRAELIKLEFLREFEMAKDETTERLVFLGCPIIAGEMGDTINQLKQDGWEIAEVNDELN